MLETLHSDYIKTARAKGLSEGSIMYRHALRNSLLPVTTMIGLEIASLFTGAILTETVFSWPGLGRLLYFSVANRDYPLVMGIFVVSSVLVILVTLIIDSLYAFLDPRITYK